MAISAEQLREGILVLVVLTGLARLGALRASRESRQRRKPTPAEEVSERILLPLLLRPGRRLVLGNDPDLERCPLVAVAARRDRAAERW